jgi:type II secretory pathway component GspD/PulD (secretin)
MKTMTWLKIKSAAGIGVAALLVGGATTVVLSDNTSISSSGVKVDANLRGVSIVSIFLKAPTSEVDAIIKEVDATVNHLADGQISIDPNSEMFRDFLKQHPEVEYLASPGIITIAGERGTLSITKTTPLNGTNANVGITLNVTPIVQPDSKIILKFRSEWSELASNIPPTIMITKQEGQTPPFPSVNLFYLRNKIDSNGQTIGKNSNNGSEILITFMNANFVRLEKILKKATAKKTQ